MGRPVFLSPQPLLTRLRSSLDGEKMAAIGPARPMPHQVIQSMNGTPGCYSLPAGAGAMGSKKGHGVGNAAGLVATTAADKKAAGKNSRMHPEQQKILEAKHGTFLKL